MIRKYTCIIVFLCFWAIVSKGAVAINEITFSPQAGKDFTPEIYDFLKINKGKPVKIIFEKGTYDFFPEKAFEKYLKISNNDNGIRKIAFYLNGFKNLEIDGGGATFMFHGGIIPFVLEDGEDYKLHHFNINWDKPFTFEGKVIANSKANMTFDIEVSPNNHYEIDNGKLYFKGYDWKLGLGENIVFDSATKRPHYFTSKYEYNSKKFPLKAKELKPGVVRFSNLKAKEVPPVGSVYIDKGPHGQNRRFPAFRVAEMKNISFSDINVYHCGAMALIAEKSENISLNKFNVLLPPNSTQLISASADATHFINCKGLINFENCRFENMLDDATNVHGTYMSVTEKLAANQYGISTMHFQQNGFNFASKGDSVRFINRDDLMPIESAKVKSIDFVNENYYVITLEKPLNKSLSKDAAIENISWFASVSMKNCSIQQNRARGILISTPGNVLIENNYFSPMMAGIRICGDANFWFESGPVNNVVINNNTFEEIGIGGHKPQAILQIDPVIKKEFRSNGYYHKNITFQNNTIKTFDPLIIYALSVDGLIIRNNTIIQTTKHPKIFKDLAQFDLQNCKNVIISDNKYQGLSLAKISILEGENLNINNNKGFQKEIVKTPNKYFYQN
ncbi:MAG TPA: hypothetical protein VFM79_06730 [Pelobium sp.]|nr:hypothetical protein [Pelobium sp.]